MVGYKWTVLADKQRPTQIIKETNRTYLNKQELEIKSPANYESRLIVLHLKNQRKNNLEQIQ